MKVTTEFAAGQFKQHLAVFTAMATANDTSRPVSRVLSMAFDRHWMTIHLGCTLPHTSCDQPGQRPGIMDWPPCGACCPYSVLLPVGFTLPDPLPCLRCALTAPFHPYPEHACAPRGGLLSVALSLKSPSPDVIRHRVSLEPGLSSPCHLPANRHMTQRDHPAD